MKIEEIEKLLNDYIHWLKDKTILKQIGSDWVEITTPHLDRHNDCLQIYACKNGNGFLLTDDGYIINDLINSGCQLDTPKRQELLKTTLAGSRQITWSCNTGKFFAKKAQYYPSNVIGK